MERWRARVLVVEDEQDIRQTVRQGLAERGYQVAVASGGREGLEAIQNNPPFDLVILALKLPGVSGSQLIRYLEQESRQTEVIVISRDATPETRTDAVSHGAFTVIPMPFEIDVLLDLVDRLLSRSRNPR